MKRLCTALAGLLVLVTTASAQDFSEQIELALDEMQELKRSKIVELIKLEEGQEEDFMDLYDEFQEVLQKENERYIEIAWQYLDQDKEMTDERARALVREYLELEESRVKVRKSYMEQFGKLLPPQQLVHVFQLENKAEAVFKHDLATHIPLLE